MAVTTHEYGTFPIRSQEGDTAYEFSPKEGRRELTPKQIRYSELNGEQKKKYVYSMLCRATKKGSESFRTFIRSSFSLMAGLEMSGILNSTSTTGVMTEISLSNLNYEWNWNGEVHGNPITLEATLNGFLAVPIRTLTYSSAIGWLAAHTIFPRVERSLSKTEKQLMQVIVGETQREEDPEISTLAIKVSRSIEYVMPLLFDATQTALFARLINHVGKVMHFTLHSQPIQEQVGDMSFYYDPYQVKIEMSEGSNFISDPMLYGLIGTGVVLYGVQAFCNFTHDLYQRAHRIEDEPLDPPV